MRMGAIALSAMLLAGCMNDDDLPNSLTLDCGRYGEVVVSEAKGLEYEDGSTATIVSRDVRYYGDMKSVENTYSDGAILTSAQMGQLSFSLDRDGIQANCYFARE